MTLLLSRSDIARLLTLDGCIERVKEAFQLLAEGRVLNPGVLTVPAAGGTFHIKAAGLKLQHTYFAAKTNANFPGNAKGRGLPTIQGVIVLCDGEDGRPLAVMDSMEITSLRTAAATAVAAQYLARPESRTVTVCGCGVQGRVQLRALKRVLPIERVLAYDADPARAAVFARETRAEAVGDLRAAARQSEVIVTCTTSTEPLLGASDIAPGAFIAAVGADSPHKQELAPDLMRAGKVVADVLDQCVVMGDLHHAIAAGAMSREDVHAELADLVAGRKPGRTCSEEITIFDSTGTAIEDVAVAAAAYEAALAAGAGIRCDLAE